LFEYGVSTATHEEVNMEREREGVRVGWVSILLNLVLFGLKFWAGLITGSVAMIADAWHTLADSLSSVIVLVGFHLGARPADREHPFGHGRAELIAAVMIGTLLVLVGLGFGREAVVRLLDHEPAEFSTFAIVVFGVSAILKEGLAQWSVRVGRRIDAPALVADAWHHRSDAVASAVIVVGALLGARFWWVDGLLGLAVAVMILHAAYDIIKDAAQRLMGSAPTESFQARAREVVSAVTPCDAEPHHLHLHSYGGHHELTLHLYLPAEMTVAEAHAISERVEEALASELKVTATVHVDPRDRARDDREGDAGRTAK
jgi:cation diffusion facilitator family transporter